jgi:hypothetical protein
VKRRLRLPAASELVRRRVMKRLALSMATLILGIPTPGSAEICSGQPADLVDVALSWCASDHGFNEGASCGLTALSIAGLSGLPASAPQPVLGSTWDRTNMMGASLLAAHKGSTDLAVTSAICCQIQNTPVFNCLQARRPEIASWLNSH